MIGAAFKSAVAANPNLPWLPLVSWISEQQQVCIRLSHLSVHVKHAVAHETASLTCCIAVPPYTADSCPEHVSICLAYAVRRVY